MRRLTSALRKSVFLRQAYRRTQQVAPFRRSRRKRIVDSYMSRPRRLAKSWVRARTEDSNFYYHLTERNRADLAALVAAVTGKSTAVIRGYFEELLQDNELARHVEASWSSDRNRRNSIVGFGRREGWYAFVRALKPKTLIETGVHDGIGACVLLSALERNERDGFSGHYYGTDIDLNAGWLIPQRLKGFGTMLYGDSIESLQDLEASVDIFINDSDHSADYEAAEYQIIKPFLSSESLILGDNSHATDALRNFSAIEGRPFLFFREEPEEHWYPGAGIGVSPASLPLT